MALRSTDEPKTMRDIFLEYMGPAPSQKEMDEARKRDAALFRARRLEEERERMRACEIIRLCAEMGLPYPPSEPYWKDEYPECDTFQEYQVASEERSKRLAKALIGAFSKEFPGSYAACEKVKTPLEPAPPRNQMERSNRVAHRQLNGSGKKGGRGRKHPHR